MMDSEKDDRPSGGYRDKMVGPGAWPETNASVFADRSAKLGAVHKELTGAKEGWQSGQTYLKSENNWAGVSATAANAKVDTHTKAMEVHEQQLTAATGWCGEAVGLIGRVKEAIVGTVDAAVNVIDETVKAANGKNADGPISKIQGYAYESNKSIVQWGADTASGKEGVSAEPPIKGKEDFEKARDKPDEGKVKPAEGDIPAFFAANPVEGERPESSVAPPVPQAVQPVANVVKPQEGARPAATGNTPVDQVANEIVGTATPVEGEKPGSSEFAPPPVVQPQVPQVSNKPPASAAPPSPATSGVTSAASPPTGGSPNLSTGGTGASGAPSPLSSGLGSGADQAASASQAAGQAPVAAAPTDPLQAFSKGFADSAGTPVHAASTGAPPLAPAPAVPASDAMAPASTHSAPTSLTGAQAPAAPVQGPPAGGSMGMGGGMPAMPLGPPPTAPPAAPMAPPPAVAPPPAPPANIAGGAQIAPIPVSAARAERDAAQNAAKRSGSDPLVLARRIAAALNAPDMVSTADYKFFWVTAVTVDGSIVVANNYGLAYIPEHVRLPEQVKMASADESMSPAERASCVTQPVAALHRWAHHHGTELRAVIATEDQLKNSDAGVHHEVLAPEDIPPSGKMVGRDRLQVIAPQAGSQLMRISDGDLVNVLPPAPVDTAQPEDRRTTLWYKVWEPLMSRSAKKNEQHMQALLEYAVHAQEQAIYAGHTAAQAEDQRRAVSDFVYWQHVGQLIADALVEQEAAPSNQDSEQPTG